MRVNRLDVCSNRINLVGQCVVCVFSLETEGSLQLRLDSCVGYLFFSILVLLSLPKALPRSITRTRIPISGSVSVTEPDFSPLALTE